MPVDMTRLVKLSEGVKHLTPKVSKGHAQRMLATGEWPGYMIGKRWYIDVQEIQDIRITRISGSMNGNEDRKDVFS